MKTLSIKEAGNRLPELLSDLEPLALTEEKSSEPTWIVLRIKDGALSKHYSVAGFTIIVLSAKDLLSDKHIREVVSQETAEEVSKENVPTFGSGKGMLTILSEDDEYLKDFKEYMQ